MSPDMVFWLCFAAFVLVTWLLIYRGFTMIGTLLEDVLAEMRKRP